MSFCVSAVPLLICTQVYLPMPRDVQWWLQQFRGQEEMAMREMEEVLVVVLEEMEKFHRNGGEKEAGEG